MKVTPPNPRAHPLTLSPSSSWVIAGVSDTDRMYFSISRADFSSDKEEQLIPPRAEMASLPPLFFCKTEGEISLTHLSQFQLSEQRCHLKKHIFFPLKLP